MPNKDIEKRRETHRRWYRNNKEKHKFYRDIHLLAQKAHPIAQNCSVEGCPLVGERHHPDYSKPIEIVWLCKTHHEEEHHKKNQNCTICGKKTLGRGFCNKHYKEQRKLTDPEYADRVKRLQKYYMLNRSK